MGGLADYAKITYKPRDNMPQSREGAAYWPGPDTCFLGVYDGVERPSR